ncbi:hypothetical protein OIDMADRAFT_114058 [Oidiodendron maius Zn]|uniref:NmrA-like domain-containing protein n=1 Tax=Oidiodendron maius (strain Zn) TaxID=913774 RepID=A0A0C3D3D0_OIDMZ|nr:hypothetical protein OIDMADRAFT_114058 [Oidiodendron maius Zn]
MMRIAIAGSGGLARIFAYHISQTAHQFIILSRTPQPVLTAFDYQVVVVDYDDQEDLRYNLQGIDLVISTVSGNAQINLIDAAANTRVRRFVPSEFEGPPSRQNPSDALDRGKAVSRDRLRYWLQRTNMKSTVFSCGVFYERFTRGGLASMGIGESTGVYYQGSYLMDIEQGTAEIVERNTSGHLIYVSMISVNDVGRFLAAAIELGIRDWPNEFRMAGDRRTVSEILSWAEAVRGAQFSTDVIRARDLNQHLDYAVYHQDYAREARVRELIATEQRRYDFTNPNLNSLVDIQPQSFWNWLTETWS